MLLDFLADPEAARRCCSRTAASETLRSYGVALAVAELRAASAGNLRELMPRGGPRVPERAAAHGALRRYLFVHAGIRPGVPLDAQDPEDLIWIRDEFLLDRRDHGFVVVHGHTPAERVPRYCRTASTSTPARCSAGRSPAWCWRGPNTGSL